MTPLPLLLNKLKSSVSILLPCKSGFIPFKKVARLVVVHIIIPSVKPPVASLKGTFMLLRETTIRELEEITSYPPLRTSFTRYTFANPIRFPVVKVIEQLMARSGEDLKMAKLLSFKLCVLDFGTCLSMYSYTHHSIPCNYDVEDAFFSSTNAPNYISTPPGYSPVTSGNISPDSLDNLTKDILSLLSILPFHDNPYMEVVQAYDAIPPPQIIIALSAIVPPPMFDSRDFFPPKEISLPKDTETPVELPIPVSLSSSVGSSSPGRSTTSPSDYLLDESIFAELDNSL
ncbi:hypothetical protein Tco_0546193 [Tanacetum coccineum]